VTPADSRRTTGQGDLPPRTCSHRAQPLPPDERRAALIAATLPLLIEHGRNVTTRQIAQAAGVAEGTIFRAFPDKETLIRAALRSALDPTPLLEDLASIDLTAPLRERVTQTTRLLQRRLVNIIKALHAVGFERPPGDYQAEDQASVEPTNTRIHHALARIFEPDRDSLRCSPQQAARLLRLVTFSGSHPLITDGNLLTPEEIVTVLLDGILRRDSSPDLSHDTA